jgi:hypothetical protein
VALGSEAPAGSLFGEQADVLGRRTQPAVTEDHGGVPKVDPELLAVLRLLKAAFGDVEVLEVIDDTPATGQPPSQGWLFDDGPPAPDDSQEQADWT